MGAPPLPPPPPTLKDASAQHISLSWSIPTVDQLFTLQIADPNSGHGFLNVYHGSDSEYTCTGLTRNTSYRLRVSASNHFFVCFCVCIVVSQVIVWNCLGNKSYQIIVWVWNELHLIFYSYRRKTRMVFLAGLMKWLLALLPTTQLLHLDQMLKAGFMPITFEFVGKPRTIRGVPTLLVIVFNWTLEKSIRRYGTG